MTPNEFCYWLQGFFETSKPKSLSKRQTQLVREHLELVFLKVTGQPIPYRSTPTMVDGIKKSKAKMAKELSKIFSEANKKKEISYCSRRSSYVPPPRLCKA